LTDTAHMSGKTGMSGKISSNFISLRVLIPMLIVLAMLLLLGYLISNEAQREADNVYMEFQSSQMDTAMRLQSSIERDVRLGLRDRLQLDFSELSLRPEVHVALLTDENNMVIASSRLSLLGKDLAQVAEKYSAQPWLIRFQGGDIDDLTIKQSVFTESKAILVSAPVRLDTPGSGLALNKLGKLCIYTDVTLPLAVHAAHIRTQVQQLMIGFVGLALLIGMLLHWTVTHRVVKLLRSAQRVGEGQLNTISGVAGPDEIGQLGLAFDAMVHKMAHSSAQLRKLSLAIEQSPNSRPCRSASPSNPRSWRNRQGRCPTVGDG